MYYTRFLDIGIVLKDFKNENLKNKNLMNKLETKKENFYLLLELGSALNESLKYYSKDNLEISKKLAFKIVEDKILKALN